MVGLPLPLYMASEQLEEAVERIQKCVKWSRGWAEANPDPVVADAVEDGLVTLGCLPKGRLQRMLSNEVLEPEDLSENQMQFLGQKGLLDPEEVETVDDDDEEEEADGADDGGVSLDDLDEDEREQLVEELREEIEEKMADDDGGADEETDQEAETADDGDEEAQEADDGGDGNDGMIRASEAM